MSPLSDRICVAAEPLAGSPNDYDPFIKMVGDARFVLLGEASHETHESYRERTLVTRRLIYQRGVKASAVRPEAEMESHYFHACLSDQFDGVIHFDHTRAVEPLERTTAWELGEVEETFPSGL